MTVFEAENAQLSTVARVAPRPGSPFAPLLRQIKQAGLLDRRIDFYIWRIVATVTMLGVGWVAFVLVGQSWWQLAVAVFLAIVFAQVGFAGHQLF